jgi:hypothetical protein
MTTATVQKTWIQRVLELRDEMIKIEEENGVISPEMMEKTNENYDVVKTVLDNEEVGTDYIDQACNVLACADFVESYLEKYVDEYYMDVAYLMEIHIEEWYVKLKEALG